MAPEPPPPWSTCATCGDATPPGATQCPTCGKEVPSSTERAATGPKRKLRFRIHRALRITLVVGVVVGLIGVMGWAIYTGPPIAADPLTHSWTLPIGPGNFSYFSGAVTGGDYITGNFTVMSPPGALVLLEVFNSSSFHDFIHGAAGASPQDAPQNETSGLIDFAAEYSNTYYFVWINAYAPSSHIGIDVYANTQYMSSVVVE
ncbi:MAG: hypothetical protein ACYDFT_02005 [Thermoplasmata archaeon]